MTSSIIGFGLRNSRRNSRKVRPWHFLLIIIVFGAVSLFALRNNNAQMVVYREAVYAADESGDQAQIELALRNLRNHIYNHMNTSLTSSTNAVHPPIQLKYSYERAQAAQQEKLGQINASLYHEAQQSCEAQNQNGSGAETISCIERFAASRGIILSDIPDALYKFDFVSATWSPDLAGWSLVITTLSLVAFTFSSLFELWKKKLI